MTNVTKADYEDDVRMKKEKEYLDEAPSTSLIKGASALVVSVGLFFVILMLVVMTPDPNHELNYKIFFIVEGILFLVFLYGGYKLDKLAKFLRLCERTTLCYQKNSKEK